MVESAGNGLVVITGVTGFVGSQVCHAFLKSGKYKVRGTTRDLNNAAKINPLKKAYGEVLFDQLELVQADLLDAASILNACQGATYIVHVASPCHFEKSPKDENEVIRPARDGTINVLDAARQHKVKRVVVTSSIDAIANFDESDKIELVDESHWSQEDYKYNDAYTKSKLLAEKAAWSFVENLPADQKFDLVVLNPAYIMGPAITAGGDDNSVSMVKSFITNSMEGIPRVHYPMVDIRDVCDAHMKALEIDNAANKRIILFAEAYWLTDIGKTLHEDLSQDYSLKIKYGEMKLWALKIAAAVSAEAKMCVDLWDVKLDHISVQRSKDILGIEYRPIKQSIIDMGRSVVEAGMVPAKKK